MEKINKIPIGECMKMCPEKEIERRQQEGLLHELEMLEGTKFSKRPDCDRNKIVKQFVRSNAGHKDHDLSTLRPAPVLIKTVDYLLQKVINEKSLPWSVVHDYLYDRLRSIRQDMIIQDINGETKIYILENCALFHLYSSYVLCEEPQRIFDAHNNKKQLRECIDSLLTQYDEYCPNSTNRNLFEAIYIILYLGSINALSRYATLNTKLKNNKLIQLAKRLSIWKINDNYYRILREVCRMPVLMRLAINSFIPSLQFQFLIRLNHCYHSNNCKYPIDRLAKLLYPFEPYSDGIDLTRTICFTYDIEQVNELQIKFNKNHMNYVEMKIWKKWGNLEPIFSELLIIP